MTACRVDEGWLVCVAARATRRHARRIFSEVDVRALAIVAAEVDRADRDDDWMQAAAALTAIARHRPFRTGNRAAAWLTAVMILDASGVRLSLPDDDVVALLRKVERDPVPVEDVARVLVGCVTPAEVPHHRLLWSCPVCHRTLHVFERDQVRHGALLVGTSRFELAARCWYEHRAHDRRGRPVPIAVDGAERDPWRPVVRDRRSDALLMLVGEEAYLLSPEGSRYSVTRHRDVDAGSLVGSWDALARSGEPAGSVPVGAVRFDDRTDMVDWHGVTANLTPADDDAGADAARAEREAVLA